MRLLLLAALALAPAAVACAQPAPPAAANAAGPPMSPVNCGALTKGTLICVRNATWNTISKITCSGFWGTDNLSIPEGTIRPGETTIVDFDRGKCNTHITVFTLEGRQHQFDGFDTTQNTQLRVDPK